MSSPRIFLWLVLLLMTLKPLSADDSEVIRYPWLEHEGQIQLQLDDGSLGSPAEGRFEPAGNGLAPFPASDTLFVRRFRPAWKLHLSPRVNLDTEFEIDPQQMKVTTLDLLLNYKLATDTNLALGRYKVPFGWEGFRSSRTINTVERSDATAYMYPERDIGLTLFHKPGDLGEFSLGVFLGQPRSDGEPNGGMDLVGRAVFQLRDGLHLGVSGHLGTFRPTGSGQDIPVKRVGAEMRFEEGPFKLESEAIWSDGYNTAAKADTRAFGYYVAGVYRLAEPVDLVLHYDRFDPDLEHRGGDIVDNRTDARDRKVIGVNYYLNREPVHRIMLNYEIRQTLEGVGEDSAGFRLRYQIAW